MLRHAIGLALALALPLSSGSLDLGAHAHADEGDGVYRRFDGDLGVGLDLGGGYRLRTRDEALPGGGYGEVGARLRVLDTGGPFVSYRHAAGDPDAGLLLVGIELRPLFPALYLLDIRLAEFPALLLESLSLELGAAIGPLSLAGAGEVGVGWVLGFGLEIPLALPSWLRAPWRAIVLRLSGRRTFVGPDQRGGPSTRVGGWELGLALGLRFGVDAGIARWEPRRYRTPSG